MARPNPLADPEFAQSVAEAFAAGLSRQQMCEMFGMRDLDTITRWRKDPRVAPRALKIIEDRVLQVTRKVDGIIASRLENAEELSMHDLLAVRKEFLGGALRAQTEQADDATLAEAAEFLEGNPEAAAQLDAILAGEELNPGT